jgi:hypothetical protein
MWCPRNTQELFAKEHFFGLSFNPALRKRVKMYALCELKHRLIDSPVLAFPRFDISFYLAVDTSAKGIGYVLYQKHPGNDGLASVQPVYSGFGNYIVGEWPTIGHKWLLSVVFVLMDGAPHRMWRNKLESMILLQLIHLGSKLNKKCN